MLNGSHLRTLEQPNRPPATLKLTSPRSRVSLPLVAQVLRHTSSLKCIAFLLPQVSPIRQPSRPSPCLVSVFSLHFSILSSIHVFHHCQLFVMDIICPFLTICFQISASSSRQADMSEPFGLSSDIAQCPAAAGRHIRQLRCFLHHLVPSSRSDLHISLSRSSSQNP